MRKCLMGMWVAACLLTGCVEQVVPVPDHPVSQLPPGWCYVDRVAPSVRVELKYAGCDNFVGRPIAGYTGRRAILRRDAAEGLRRASDELKKKGYGLLIWDAYRPAGAMKDFRRWSRTPDNRMQSRFYPRISKRGIYDGKYIGDMSEHSWGIAVDITLVHLRTGKEVDMGGHHDLLDPSSATDSPLVTPTQRRHRHILREAMEKGGFRNYSKEWWHYFLKDSQPWFMYGFPLDDHLPESPSR